MLFDPRLPGALLAEICALAGEFRVAGIELRGMGGRMDLPAYCAEQHLTPAVVREICQRHRARLVVAGSSFKLTAANEKDRAELLDYGALGGALAIPMSACSAAAPGGRL